MYPSPKKHSGNQSFQLLSPLKINQAQGMTNIEHNRNNRKDIIGDL